MGKDYILFDRTAVIKNVPANKIRIAVTVGGEDFLTAHWQIAPEERPVRKCETSQKGLFQTPGRQRTPPKNSGGHADTGTGPVYTGCGPAILADGAEL